MNVLSASEESFKFFYLSLINKKPSLQALTNLNV